MRNYRLITSLVAPLLPLWLQWRKLHGKEDAMRLGERYGYASVPRPPGTLIWLHAASVGEANSILVFIQKIAKKYPHFTLLLTTGTVTSAALMQKRLPKGVIHQYVPIDTPDATRRFIAHWKPNIAFWVESEFWPNLVMETNDSEAFMIIVNGRMSEKSFAGWSKRPSISRPMLSSFDATFAQTPDDGKRLSALGAKGVEYVGNLKYDAELLPCNEEELIDMQAALSTRAVWLAASTHPGEEALIAKAHTILAGRHPNLLTVIVPRHPARGPEIATALNKTATTQLRSHQKDIAPATSIYIADTLGELGLFYRACEIVFMGGSLIKHGGQNPLEAARLSCAILTGTHTHNFADMYTDMESAGALIRVNTPDALALHVDLLLKDLPSRDKLQNTVKRWMDGKSGTADRLMRALEPIFDPAPPAPEKPKETPQEIMAREAKP